MKRRLNFDPLARPYRWLEYLTFGRALERCRFHFLPALTAAKHALVLGDGDGRFLARLLAANPDLHADVVDISPAMLHLLNERLTPEARERVTLHQMDARDFMPPETSYDLVVTHFFLDCLAEPELAALVDKIASRLQPGSIWVISEFAQPRGRVASLVGKVIVSVLYRIFVMLTGLETRSLPDHGAILQGHGFRLAAERQWLRGLLASQLWQY